MRRVQCPYCGKPKDLADHDGMEYEEDHLLDEECGRCGKNFVATVVKTFTWKGRKADCLNGGEHLFGEWKFRCRYSSRQRKFVRSCHACGEVEEI